MEASTSAGASASAVPKKKRFLVLKTRVTPESDSSAPSTSTTATATVNQLQSDGNTPKKGPNPSEDESGNEQKSLDATFESRMKLIKEQTIALKLSIPECSHSKEPEVLIWKDLPGIPSVDIGTVDLVEITSIKCPFSFYLVFEKTLNYNFGNPEWGKHFLRFSGGLEALKGITYALTTYFEEPVRSVAVGKDGFIPSQLVAVKYNLTNGLDFTLPSSSSNPVVGTSATDKFEMRRGVINEITVDSKDIYNVYLLDFGFQVNASKDCVFPLPAPFHSIAPLAVRCGLFGVSPFTLEWSEEATNVFKNAIAEHLQGQGETPSFHAEICSIEPGLLSPEEVVQVMLRPLKRSSEEQECASASASTSKPTDPEVNDFTELLAKKNLGYLWNPFPARPGLMGGTPPYTKNLKYPAAFNDRLALNEFRVNPSDALLLTSNRPKSFPFLKEDELARDLYRLFSLRQDHLVGVAGLNNRLLLYKNDANPNDDDNNDKHKDEEDEDSDN